MGSFLGLVAGIVLFATAGMWFRRLRAVRIPRNRSGFYAGMGVAAVLGVVALAVGTGWFASITAALAIVGGGGFLVLQLLSGQERRVPAVAVGGPIIDFTTLDDRGEPFDLATLRGRPFLLKFFRGHW